MTRAPPDGAARAAGGPRATPGGRATAGLLLAALVLVVLVRAWVQFDEVFRGGAVALAGNDPYRYRYWVEGLLASGLDPLDPFDLARLPAEVRRNDVLFMWAAWLAAAGLGGDGRAAGLVLAWYPVASAVATATLVYVLAARLTADRRVALLAVVVLALTPAHAFRTMLGFGDHHSFDYVALALTATALVWLVTTGSSGRPWRRADWWVAVGLLGGAVATQSLAWRGGPILLVPLGVYAAAAAVSGVRAGRSPLAENGGLLAGLAVATGLAALIHLGPNWAPAYRGFAPLLLFGAVLGVLGAGEVVVRAGWRWPAAAVGAPLAAAAWTGLVVVEVPALLDGARGFAAFLERTSRQRAVGIGETASLVGSVETPLSLFGLLLVVAVPVMGWVLVELVRAHQPAWIVASAYGWVFLALSVNRVRFAGQLALFVSVFAAVGLVWLAAQMEHATPLSRFERPRETLADGWRRPERHDPLRATAALALLVLLVTGVGVAQVPGTMDRVTVDDTRYEAARSMAEHAEDRGWAYPRSYVFSSWGTSLMYNYEVNGESRSYSHARRHYRPFVSSSDAEGWYAELEGRAGFVVVRSSRFAYPTDSMQVRLGERYGSAGDGVAGLAHYRLVYASGDGTLAAFALVPGATVVGRAAANETVDVETDVRVGDASFTYRRTVRTDADGRYAVTVPYPGRYSVAGDAVVVTEANVTDGDTLER